MQGKVKTRETSAVSCGDPSYQEDQHIKVVVVIHHFMKKIYVQKHPLHCGAASYMNAKISPKRWNEKIEEELHEKGRIRPSQIFLGPSFLEIDKSAELYVGRKGKMLDKKLLNLIKEVESLSGEELEKCEEYYRHLVEKNRGRVHFVENLDQMLERMEKLWKSNRKILVLISTKHFQNIIEKKRKDVPGTVPHWVYLVRVEEETYKIADSYTGEILALSKQDFKESVRDLKRWGICYQFVSL